MRVAAGIVAGCLLVACKAEDDYPIQPPTPGGSGMPRPGADAGGDGDAGTSGLVRGKVCVVTDLRQPANCAVSGSRDVVVREFGTTTQVVSSEGGAFELRVAARDVAVLEVGVGNRDLVPSLVPVPVGAAPTQQAPVPRAAEYQATLDRLTGLPPIGSGTLALYFLKRDGGALPGVVVVPPEGTVHAPLYDVAGDAQWVSDGETGPYGASLLVGVPAGTVAAGATGSLGEVLSVSGVPIADGHVTFVTRPVTP